MAVVNPRTLKTRILVPPREGRISVGLAVARGKLLVAGAGTLPSGGNNAPFYVYDQHTGHQIAACTIKRASLLNDVVVLRGVAYFTDSAAAQLVAVRLKTVRQCKVRFVPLPDVFRIRERGEFRGNGIAVFKNRLLVANLMDGSVYAVHPRGKVKPQVLIASPNANRPDGLTVVGCVLYVVENTTGNVSLWKLRKKGNQLTATKFGDVSSDSFGTPTTSAVLGGRLFVANARFNDITPETDISKEDFTVSVVRRFASRAQRREAMKC